MFFAAVVILSALFGALFATNQTDLKRLIAYSGVIQSGFILSGITSGINGISASVFYLVTYVIQLIGLFYIFSLISGSLGSNFSVENLNGLFKNNKLITIAFSVFMLGVAGLPLTSGFVSKFILITNLWSYEKYTLVVVLMLSTVAGFYFYLRPVWVASIEKSEKELSIISTTLSDKLVLIILSGLTIALGLFPNTLINITRWMVESYL